MSKANRRVKKRRKESGAMQILEEAFHLVRTAGVKAYWRYYLGAVPWALGLLYFSADMGRSSLAARDAAFLSIALAGIYLWMRTMQASFCTVLWEQLNPGGVPAMNRTERFRALGALALVHSLQAPLLAVGLFFAIPLGWILAMQQNFSVLALTRKPGRRPLRDLFLDAIRMAHEQWAQNHAILVVFFFVSLFTWVNLVTAVLFVSGMGKSIFGSENVFTLSPEAAMMNTTFLLGSFLLTQLVIGPLFTATYTLRCFYAGSRTSGDDLLSRLESCRAKRVEEERRERATLGRVAALVLLAASLVASPVAAQEPPGAGGDLPTVREERLREEITETLEQKKYQWQLSRRVEEAELQEKSWLARRLEEIAASVKEAMKAFGEWFEEAMRKLFERRISVPGGGKGDGKWLEGLSSTASIALVVGVLALLVWLSIQLYRRYRGREDSASGDDGGGKVIDLESEEIVATQLHEDEWLELAREQIGKGEERLAIRALYLATLAHLGERGLLKIARFKSNRDYRRELERRARELVDLGRAFEANTAIYERTWYGLHRPAPGAVDEFLKNHATIRDAALPAANERPMPAGVR